MGWLESDFGSRVSKWVGGHAREGRGSEGRHTRGGWCSVVQCTGGRCEGGGWGCGVWRLTRRVWGDAVEANVRWRGIVEADARGWGCAMEVDKGEEGRVSARGRLLDGNEGGKPCLDRRGHSPRVHQHHHRRPYLTPLWLRITVHLACAVPPTTASHVLSPPLQLPRPLLAHHPPRRPPLIMTSPPSRGAIARAPSPRQPPSLMPSPPSVLRACPYPLAHT